MSEPGLARVGDTWFRFDTLDAWRHERMRRPLTPLINADADASWVTVGDGRYGTDANYLLRAGVKRVHCTDMSETLLKIGKQQGFIQDYSVQNAESLDFADNSFDFVYCKEAFHHFPRPYVALYEMFRIARKAVLITEPRDQIADKAPLWFIAGAARTILGRNRAQHAFEPVGNYVYGISEREIDKFMLGMHYRYVAYTGCNDAYFPGVEFVPIKPVSMSDRKKKAVLLFKILMRDLLCRIGINKTSLITAALFKEKPSDSTLAALKASGWEIRELPENPYLN